MSLDLLAASLLRSMIAGKAVLRVGEGVKKSWRSGFLILLQSLNNFKIQKYYQNKPIFNVHLRNGLPKIKDVAYAINIDEYESIGTHWIALYMKGGNVTYFESFGIEYIPKVIIKKQAHKQWKYSKYL